MNTANEQYTTRLLKSGTWWKRLLDVQRPYRMYLRRLQLGLVLDIGCGVGRSLENIGRGQGVGIDHNPYSVEIAKSRGLIAFTPEEFRQSSYAEAARFDSLLLSHVAEHMRPPETMALIREHLGYLKPGGRVVLITPQEAGYRSDETHVEFVDFQVASKILDECGLKVSKQQSFPLPRWCGKLFKYNEFISIGEKQT